MTIVNIIKSFADALSQKPSFFHGEAYEQNLQDDNTHFPLVMLDHPIRAKLKIAGIGNFTKTYQLNIFFLDKTNLEDLQVDRQPVLDAMYTMCREFLVRVERSPLVYKIESAETEETPQNLFDLGVDGLCLKVSLTVLDNSPVCLT